MVHNKKIGFIGLGNMGLPMAIRLAERNFQVHAYDIRPERAHGLDAYGIRWADSLEQLASDCSIIIIMVFNGAQVRRIVLDPGGILEHARPETLIIDMTSSDPTTARDISEPCAARGVRVMDAPVSGGVAGAKQGTLTFMVGGDESQIEEVQDIFAALGKKYVFMGPLGSGHIMKAINNFVGATTVAVTTEAVAMALKGGLNIERAVEVLASSTGTSDAATRKFPKHVFPDREAGFSIGLMQKDLKNYLQFASSTGIPTFISDVVCQLWQLNVLEGRADKDIIYYVDRYADWCGASIRGIRRDDTDG